MTATSDRLAEELHELGKKELGPRLTEAEWLRLSRGRRRWRRRTAAATAAVVLAEVAAAIAWAAWSDALAAEWPRAGAA